MDSIIIPWVDPLLAVKGHMGVEHGTLLTTVVPIYSYVVRGQHTQRKTFNTAPKITRFPSTKVS